MEMKENCVVDRPGHRHRKGGALDPCIPNVCDKCKSDYAMYGKGGEWFCSECWIESAKSICS